MVAFFTLTVAGTAVCVVTPPRIVAMLSTPMFSSNNFLHLADAVGLPPVISAVLFLLGMLQKYAAALAGPEARFCAMLMGLVGSTAYFQVRSGRVSFRRFLTLLVAFYLY
jgi:hypothetical protein